MNNVASNLSICTLPSSKTIISRLCFAEFSFHYENHKNNHEDKLALK